MKAFRALMMFALLGGFAMSVGCNTTKGAGKDLERAGDKIQDSADRHGAS